MKTCAKWITYLQMDWQGHTLESPYQFRLISLKIMGCCYLILETETCPWNKRTFTDIYKVTKPGGNKKNPSLYAKYIWSKIQGDQVLLLISKFQSTERKSTQIPNQI